MEILSGGRFLVSRLVGQKRLRACFCPSQLAMLAIALTSCGSAFAATDFNGYYDYATWASTSNYGATTLVSTIDGPQQTLTLYEDDGCSRGDGCCVEGL